MTREEFFSEWLNLLQVEKKMNESDELGFINEWDSLAAVSTMALFNKKLKLKLSAMSIKSCVTIKDMLDLGSSTYE